MRKTALTAFVLMTSLIAFLSPQIALANWVDWALSYSIGIPAGESADSYKLSLIGIGGDVEIPVHPFINLVVGLSYQVFEHKTINDYKLAVIPITFGIEHPAILGNIAFYPGTGGSFTLMKRNLAAYEDENKAGVWFGGRFYYAINPNLRIGAGANFHMIFTENEKTSWIQVPIGIKVWF